MVAVKTLQGYLYLFTALQMNTYSIQQNLLCTVDIAKTQMLMLRSQFLDHMYILA